MTVRLLHYSDIENATDDPQRIGQLVGCLREKKAARTVVCGTGDTTAPGLLSMETGGEHILPFYEAVGPDFSTVGNHDFDNGVDALRDVIANSPQTWLVANLQEDDRPFAHNLGVRSTAVASIGDGSEAVRVGLVGVTDSETLGGHVFEAGIEATDPVTAAERSVADLRSETDYVVVLSHAGRRDDEIARLDGVDLVLGGHDHQERADTVADTPVVHPGERGKLLSAVELADGSATAELHDVTEFPAAEDVTASFRDLYADLGLDETVTRLERPLRRERRDLYPESAMGNFAVDAVRWVADADVAVLHPGMLRSGPPLGDDVWLGEVRSLAPFDNELLSTRLVGSELVALFESFAFPEVLADYDLGPEVYGHVSGAWLSWRRSDEDLELVDVTVDGRAPDPSKRYTVAAPEFEFYSDLYPVLDDDRIEASHGDHQDALAAYTREHGIDTEPEGRMQLVSDTASAPFRSLR